MAGTTNILQWNPNATNQETDTQYAADSQRSGGATNPSVFDATLANKAFYQWSTFLTALFQAFANKGYTTSDSNLSTLTAQCANFLTAADIRSNLVAPPSASTITCDMSKYLGFEITLTGDTALTVENNQLGDTVIFLLAQNSTGGYTVTWPSNVLGASQPDPTANSVSCQIFKSDDVGHLIAAGPMISFTSGIVNTPIGAAGPSTGGFTTLDATTLTTTSTANVGSLQVLGAAPNGQVLTGNGTSYVPAALPPVIGTRYNVTSSRAFGTTYTNTYGAPITVTGYGVTIGGSVGSVACFVNSVADFANTVGGTVDNGVCGFSFTVPQGATYQVVANSLTNGQGTAVSSIGVWIETVIS